MSGHSGKSSLEAHEQEMKVNALEEWLFGPEGGTPPPTYRPATKHDSHHLDAETSTLFRGRGDQDTDKEYQQIRRERTFKADALDIDIPTGYAPVTFVEDDTILVAPIGSNLRELALANNIPIYADLAKVLNCRGLGLCTTCRVSVEPADGVTPPTDIEKEHLIRDNPKLRLSCQCEITGPVKISTKPARDYGKIFTNFARNAALFGIFSLLMLCLLLVIGFDVVGLWF